MISFYDSFSTEKYDKSNNKINKMMMITCTIPLLVVFAFNLSGQNIDASTSYSVDKCIKNQEDVTDQIKCLKSIYVEIDSSMNLYYKLLIQSYKLKANNKSIRKFKKSQIMWQKMKVKQCASFYKIVPQEDQEIVKYKCLIELTTNRRNELSNFLNRFRL